MKRRVWIITLCCLTLFLGGHLAGQTKQTSKQKTKPAQSPVAEEEQGAEAKVPVKEDLKRLVLKDGSYQGVMKYQIIGERVHYLSAERYTWEDIPSSLVDWDASRRYMAEASTDTSRSGVREIDAEAEAERQKEEALSPTVSPGIRLPVTGGVFLLDVYQGKPELNELVQVGADINKNTKGNILRGAINPVAGNKQTIELPGDHARVQSHVADPFLYVLAESDENASSPNMEAEKKRWRVVRVENKKGKRIIGNINIAIYGKVKQNATYVDTDVTLVSGSWLKVVPTQPLAPGEYALVEILGRDGINRFVWDFGVNTTAPANPGAWKAQQTKASDADEAPVLRQHKPQ